MPIQKVQFRPGVNRETTNYANEGGFFVSDKIRFRGGFAQKIGGWVNISPNTVGGTFKGIARSLWNWVTLTSQNLLGVGTNQKFYVELGGAYYDITPLRATSVTLSDNPFSVTSGSKNVFVNSTAHGTSIGSFVTFSGATAITGGGMSLVLNGEFEVVNVSSANSFTILAPEVATSTVTGGGSLVLADYQINAGNAVYTTSVGWGGPPWGFGGWGSNQPEGVPLRLWSQFNYGDDLLFAERGGEIYYWTKDTSTWARAVSLETKTNSIVKFSTFATAGSGATTLTVSDATGINTGAVVTGAGVPDDAYVIETWDGSLNVIISAATTSAVSGTLSFSYAGRHVPNRTNLIISSPVNDFTLAMGANPYSPVDFTTDFDPLLVRWSDQDNPWDWVPETTNQSGEQRLSSGSEIVAAVGTRQEILVLTDTSIYSMQYLGPPFVWGFNILDEDISIASQNALISVNNATYWMGTDKFFVYDGRVNTLPCTVRQHVFSTLNRSQIAQVMCGNNEAFSEIWWFYPGTGSNINSLYVTYNYLDNVWAYGSLPRSAFVRQTIREFPMLSFSIQESYLSADINATQDTITLINASSYPAAGSIVIDSEEITYTGVSTTDTLTGCIRGANGTVAASHTAYTPVSMTAPNQVMFHEVGWDDTSTGTAQPITAFIESSDFAIGDGDHFAFVSRIIPDVKFLGSDTQENPNPSVDLTLYPHNFPGAVYGTGDTDAVTATVVLPIERYTEQVFTRIRGRQLAFRVASSALGVAWQMGAMRLDIRPDGRR